MQRAGALARVGGGVAEGLHQADGRVAAAVEPAGAKALAREASRSVTGAVNMRSCAGGRGLWTGRDVHAGAVADLDARHLAAAQRGVGHVLQRGQVAGVEAQVGHRRHLPRHRLAFGVEGGFERRQPAVREPAGERQRHRRARHHAQAEQVALQAAAPTTSGARRLGSEAAFGTGVGRTGARAPQRARRRLRCASSGGGHPLGQFAFVGQAQAESARHRGVDAHGRRRRRLHQHALLLRCPAPRCQLLAERRAPAAPAAPASTPRPRGRPSAPARRWRRTPAGRRSAPARSTASVAAWLSPIWSGSTISASLRRHHQAQRGRERLGVGRVLAPAGPSACARRAAVRAPAAPTRRVATTPRRRFCGSTARRSAPAGRPSPGRAAARRRGGRRAAGRGCWPCRLS